MPKKITEYKLLPLLRKYINETKKGKHLQRNGKKIKKGSIENYVFLEKLLSDFSIQKNFDLRLKVINAAKKKEFDAEQKYWKKFYTDFTSFLYEDLDHYDNYVGTVTKLLRAFFNYLNIEKGLSIGLFHKKFFTPTEEIEIIVLSPERLNHLVSSKELEQKLSPALKDIKNVFVFGSSVALRFSDLMNLTQSNIETINGRTYLNVQSKKTQTFTKVKLPGYAVDIIAKYQKQYTSRLLPKYNKAQLNKKIKVLMELAGFTEPVNRTRQKRGIPVKVFKDVKTRSTYRFCDAITTHTMRRTAITTMLSLGMNEQMVRQISGHAANSKEFYRYVSFAQTYVDNEIDSVHEKLSKKELELAL
jgi:integrase